MNKNFIFKVASGVLFLVVAVLWLLSALLPEAFGEHSLSWLIALFAGGMAVIFIVRGILEKNLTSIRKFYVFLGALFAVAGVCALIGMFIPANVVLPVIAVALSAVGLVSTLGVRGKKWDAGDNQEPGYKNYYQRKAEAEQAAKNAESTETTETNKTTETPSLSGEEKK